MIATLLACASLAAATVAPLDAEVAARRHLASPQAHLELGLTDADLDALQVVRRYTTPSTGATTLWLQQTVDGLPVLGATIRFGIDASGHVYWARPDHLVPGLTATGIRAISPTAACTAAADAVSIPMPRATATTPLTDRVLQFTAADLGSTATVEAVVLPSGHPGYQVVVEQTTPTDLWSVIIDAATGRVLLRDQLRFNVQDGLAFDGQYPDTLTGGVAQSLQPFAITAESPVGWLFAAPDPRAPLTTGNNIEAKEDWVGDNEVTVGLFANGGVNQEFRFTFTDSYATTGTDYMTDTSAAITNAFYWGNRWHDLTYSLGFDEAAGNCQVSNFGLGGNERDPIRIDIQNNVTAGIPPTLPASFVPADGSSPRIELRIDTRTRKIDAAFDNDLILHELTHVLSTRLVAGGTAGCFDDLEARALAESVSDFLPMNLFNSPVLAEYATGNLATGVRVYAADANPRTFCDFCAVACSSNTESEILSATLWDLRAAIGQATAIQLLVDALKLVPCSPSWIDLRDGLVAADAVRYAGANRCPILTAFRDRGLGYEAQPFDDGACDLQFVDPVCSNEAFLRIGSVAWSDLLGGDGDGFIGVGETIDLDLTLSNADGVATATTVRVTVTSLTPGITVTTATATYADIVAGASGTGLAPIQFVVGPAYVCGAPLRFSAAIEWQAPLRTRSEPVTLATTSIDGVFIYSDDFEGGPGPWTPTLPAAVQAGVNHTPGGSQSYSMLGGCWVANETTCASASPCNDTCAALTSMRFLLPAAHTAFLTFWTQYNLEDGWDGLLAQVSIDGGRSWAEAAFEGGRALDSTDTGCALPLGAASALTGPPGNAGLTPWTPARVDLSPWRGLEVTVRLVLHQDGCTVFEGAYIDDIGIAIQHCQATPFVKLHALERSLRDDLDPTCTDADSTPDPAETVALEATIVNIGNVIAPGASASLETTNPNVLGLPATSPLGDLAPGESGQASLPFSIAGIASVGCGEGAALTLHATSTYPSDDAFPVDVALRQDSALTTWYDDFETLTGWTATLGPDGSANDWALRELNCLSGPGRRWFWSTHVAMVAAACSTAEPDYSADSDSILTSPPIDLGAPAARLVELRWQTHAIANTVIGFVEVSIDHDDDGIYTPVVNASGGLGSPVASQFAIDLTNPPAGTPLPANETEATVRIRFRFRALAPDPGGTADSVGMLIDELLLSYQGCPQSDCAGGCVGTPTAPPAVGNVLLGTKTATGAQFGWLDDPTVDDFELARSASRDFALPLTSIGRTASGSPQLEDVGALALPGLHTYRVAAARCGLQSPF